MRDKPSLTPEQKEKFKYLCRPCVLCGAPIGNDHTCPTPTRHPWRSFHPSELDALRVALGQEGWSTEDKERLLNYAEFLESVVADMAISETSREQEYLNATDVLRKTIQKQEKQLVRQAEALRQMYASAVPNAKEHPTMFTAWRNAEEVLNRRQSGDVNE